MDHTRRYLLKAFAAFSVCAPAITYGTEASSAPTGFKKAPIDVPFRIVTRSVRSSGAIHYGDFITSERRYIELCPDDTKAGGVFVGCEYYSRMVNRVVSSSYWPGIEGLKEDADPDMIKAYVLCLMPEFKTSDVIRSGNKGWTYNEDTL